MKLHDFDRFELHCSLQEQNMGVPSPLVPLDVPVHPIVSLSLILIDRKVETRTWWSYLNNLSRKSIASLLTNRWFSELTKLCQLFLGNLPRTSSYWGSSSISYRSRYSKRSSVPRTFAILTSWSVLLLPWKNGSLRKIIDANIAPRDHMSRE